jgi:hypothetical protein
LQKLWKFEFDTKGIMKYKLSYWVSIWYVIKEGIKELCEICESRQRLVTHHRNGDYKDNTLDNLSVVCRCCHNKIHKTKRLRL